MVWVTRTRLKIDRIACPWLIRRLVDLRAVIRFVALRGGGRDGALQRSPFRHRGRSSVIVKLCSFNVMSMEFGLSIDDLHRQWSARRA